MIKMLKEGKVLLLDEPTSALEVDIWRVSEESLENFTGCAVVISYDRLSLDRLATHNNTFEGDSPIRWFRQQFRSLWGQAATARAGSGPAVSGEVSETDALTAFGRCFSGSGSRWVRPSACDKGQRRRI